MSGLRPTGWVLLVGSAALVLFSTWRMTQRVGAFNEQALPTTYHFQREAGREFLFRDVPVKLQDASIDGVPAMTLSYGDKAVTFPVHKPHVENFKDLTVYDEWLSVVAFTPTEKGKINANPYTDDDWRLVVVNRRTAPGFDEETFGNVRVRDWVFEMYELTPSGEVVRTLHQFPDRRGRLPAEVDARRAQTKAGETPAPGDEKLTDIALITERGWAWQAALFAVPKAQMSRYRFKTDAVGGAGDVEGMRWTLPAAGFGVMGVVAGCALLMMSATRREPQAVAAG